MSSAKTPIKVAVTGAAGQIGYSLLFRIACGDLLGPDTPGRAAPARDHPRPSRPSRGSSWSSTDCAFPTARPGIEIGDDPTTVFDGVNHRPARRRPPPRPEGHGARRPPRGQRRHLRRRRARPSAEVAAERHPRSLVHRQPGQHQRPHRPEQRGRTSRPSASPRSPASTTTARTGQLVRQGSACRSPRSSRMTIWGNHSATQYPDLFHAEVGGKQRRRGRGRPGLARGRLHPDRRRSAAPPSSPPAAPRRPPPPRRPPSTTPATWVAGHRGGRLDLDGRARPTARTASPRVSISSFPVTT